MTKIADNFGNYVDYCPGGAGSATCLDALGNRKSENTYAVGNTTPTRLLTRSFNALNRLTDQLDAQARPTHFTYDPNGNRIDQTDPLLVATHAVYDPLNRLKSTVQDYQGTNPSTANATTSYAYDARDNTKQITDPNALSTTYTYDGLSNLDALGSPDTGNTTYAQDVAGNRSQQIDGRGTTDSYSYDALNRLIGIKYGSTISVGHSYDQPNSTTGCTVSYPIGRMTGMGDHSGSTTYCDHRGNVVKKVQVTQGTTYAIGYEYNLADRLMAIDYPDGARVQYTRDTIGRVLTVKIRPTLSGTLTNVISAVTYQPFGPALTYTFAAGSQSLALSYDQNYWLTDVAGSVLNLHFCRDAVANITRLKTATPACTGTPTEQYAYDALYRLSQVQNGSGGLIEGYTYNLTGDRLSKTQGGTATTYGYGSPLTRHRLLTVGSDSRDYDNDGNLIDGNAPSRTYTFNDQNRLSAASRSGPAFGSSGTYDYNARGERVVKDGIGPLLQHNPAHFAYDESGRLLTDNGNGNPNPTDYVYVDDRPIALVRSGAIYYVHSDQLGTPRAITSAVSGTNVWSWSWQGNAFGEQPPISSLTVSLRFPGQYYDAETGLNYNGRRDYESSTGRYIESDPIGIDGGPSTYAYAEADPLLLSDPFGLATYIEFPPDKEGDMKNALQEAINKLLECKDKFFCLKDDQTETIIRKLNSARFVYRPGLEDCGETGRFPGARTIKVSPNAFNFGKCCDLSSTLAHEANHLGRPGANGSESASQELEKRCFNCPRPQR